MKSNFINGIAIAVVFGFFCSCTGAGSGTDAVTLKFNLEKGKSYEYAMKTHFDMTLDMKGKKMETGGDVDFGFNMKVDDVDAQGNRMLTNSYDAIRFRMNAMGMDMGYDSKNIGDTTHENLTSGIFRKIFGAMVGKSFKMTMSPTGEITKIVGLREMVDAMSEHLNVPDNMKEKMSQQFKQSFNEDQVRQNFQQGFGFYPGKPVKVGDSWNKNLNTNINNMAMNLDSKYTVREIMGNNVTIDVTSMIKAGGGDTASVAGHLDMKGESKGSMVVDLPTGLAKNSRVEMNMKLSSPALQQPMDMKMTMTIEGKQL